MGSLVPAYKGRYNGKGPNERLAAGERILDGRNKGVQLHVLAEREGVSRATAHRYLKAALDARIAPTVDEYRRQQNDQLDQIERENAGQFELAEHLIREAAKHPIDAGPNYALMLQALSVRSKAIEQRIRIAERRAKLNGLDAPVQVQATVVHLSDVDAELADMVAEARARLAADEQEAQTDA